MAFLVTIFDFHGTKIFFIIAKLNFTLLPVMTYIETKQIFFVTNYMIKFYIDNNFSQEYVLKIKGIINSIEYNLFRFY